MTHNCNCDSCCSIPDSGKLCAICLGDMKYHWSMIGTGMVGEEYSCHGYCPVPGHKFIPIPEGTSENKMKALKRLIEIQ